MSGAPGPTRLSKHRRLSHLSPLSRNKDFNVFWLGQALSVIGGSISLFALPLLVLDATGSLARMGLITAVAAVSAVGTGLFAGHVVDRVGRRRLMIVCDLSRALLLGAVPFLWLAGPRIWLLFLLTAVVGVLRTLFDVAYVTAVPHLVPAEDLTAANGRLMSTFAVGTLVGPVAAGAIATWVGPDWALGLDGATFLVSAASLRWVRLPPRPAPDGAGEERLPGGGARKAREMFLVGFRFLWSHELLRPLTVLLTLLTFVTIGATDLLIFRVRRDLDQSAATLGYVVAVSGLGTLVGALCAGRLRRLLGFGACWLGSVALVGLAVAGIGVSRDVPTIAALAAVFMFGLTVAGVCSMTLRQEVTPDPLLGRVTSVFWTVHNASGPVGAAVLTRLAQTHGVPAISLATGAFCLLLVCAGLFTPLRAGRTGRPKEPVTGSPGRGPAGGLPRRTRPGRRR
ncbi:MFS transporter [Streptomyces sp. NPDC048272]|uniref:MFS transporter n=1 Tax=Streptomyces sp. NPDC048272 TaxID=3154616 RepID=UPI0034493B3F